MGVGDLGETTSPRLNRLRIIGFNHDSQQRLRAARPDKNAATITHGFLSIANCFRQGLAARPTLTTLTIGHRDIH